MPFVCRAKEQFRLAPEQSQRIGFWSKLDLKVGGAQTSKRNTTLVYELINGMRTLCYYGG